MSDLKYESNIDRETNNNEDSHDKKRKDDKDKKIIIALLIIIIIILLMRSCGGCGEPKKTYENDKITEQPTITPTKKPELIIEGDPWDGNTNTNFQEPEEQDSTSVPVFGDIVTNSKNKEIQLYNPKENTVYFLYTITNVNSGKVVHQTNAIAPGNAVKWNVYDTMGKGTHNIKIHIDTKDVETQRICNGANLWAKVVVN